MSFDDYPVDSRSNAEVRENAKRLRRFLKQDGAERVDVLALESATEIWTVEGVRPFRYEIVGDSELPKDSGLTHYDGSKLVVQVPRRIRHKAFLGDGYARYTIAHELGHAAQHLNALIRGAAMPRRGLGNTTSTWIPKFKSAEHQAMVFGAAFLINDAFAHNLKSPEEISVQAGVSLKAACIYFEQIQDEIGHQASSERVRRMAEEVRATLNPKQGVLTGPRFLNEVCSCCGQQKLFPVGSKFMCQICDAVYDRFQDGDQID